MLGLRWEDTAQTGSIYAVSRNFCSHVRKGSGLSAYLACIHPTLSCIHEHLIIIIIINNVVNTHGKPYLKQPSSSNQQLCGLENILGPAPPTPSAGASTKPLQTSHPHEGRRSAFQIRSLPSLTGHQVTLGAHCPGIF